MRCCGAQAAIMDASRGKSPMSAGGSGGAAADGAERRAPVERHVDDDGRRLCADQQLPGAS